MRAHIVRWLKSRFETTRAVTNTKVIDGSGAEIGHDASNDTSRYRHDHSSTGDGSARPSWVVSLEERMRTMIRAQSKLSLRIDEISRSLSERSSSPVPERRPGVDPASLLDVLDRLDEARLAVADRPAVDRGLEGIADRLEGLLGAMGVERRAEIGVPVNPTLFRVVGVEHDPALCSSEDAVVIQVVRAAALRGTSVIREGEVIVSKRSS